MEGGTRKTGILAPTKFSMQNRQILTIKNSMIETAKPAPTLTPAQKRVQDLEIKLKQAKALAQKQANRVKTREHGIQRQIETRRKVLIGAYVLAKKPEITDSPDFASWLTRDDERALFGLAPVLKADGQ